MKGTLQLLFSILSLFVITACGNTNDTTAEPEAEAEVTSYSVEHAMGSTEIPDTPERVVILTNEGTEALLALGVTPVGAVMSWDHDPWYEHISTDMDGVEVVGDENEVNVEKIAELKPDLIIGNKVRQEDLYNQLNEIAPTVFSEDLAGDWKINFELYAQALNLVDEGQEVMADYDSKVEELKTTLGDKVNQEISIVRFSSRPTRIYYTDSFSGVVFEQLGFKRAEHQEKLFTEDNPMGNFAIEVDKELIPEMDADVLFYFTYADSIAVEEEWTSDPLWENLNVVKEDNAHKVSDITWNAAGGVIAANIMLDEIEEIFTQE
ncbi:iron-siderophore ABC transporter substrate-binding protein [Salipaludibacillus sp. LMS25]|jgi:iron complex transport system substrate-binding protein|uniref:ABC transporter substrate-binding protein n=1 Tax=Salipaludibacillus sp. LMS25 TaxID=2924031 RepID=UPI0020D0EDD2|nr:iron-siderophore ABC transporter substrate-binding protein [Salipaludibacillus sp. LMS25]UTR16528.1 iron-siderophore ABC transporter substrate-binding protein [Salipaludibacillus sp. LMS25]